MSYEAGYRKEIRSGFVGVNLFYNRATDLINFVTTEVYAPPFPPGIPKTLTATNSNDAHAVGVEIESEVPLGKRVRGLFNYSYQDVQDNQGERIDLSPQHKINVGIKAQISSRMEGFLGAHLVGGSVLHKAADLVTLPTYTRFDARLGYRIGSIKNPWTLSLSATNLFDDKHIEFPAAATGGSPASGVPQRRTIYFGLSGKL